MEKIKPGFELQKAEIERIEHNNLKQGRSSNGYKNERLVVFEVPIWPDPNQKPVRTLLAQTEERTACFQV